MHQVRVPSFCWHAYHLQVEAAHAALVTNQWSPEPLAHPPPDEAELLAHQRALDPLLPANVKHTAQRAAIVDVMRAHGLLDGAKGSAKGAPAFVELGAGKVSRVGH